MANFARYNAKESVVTVDGVYITGLSEDFWSFEKQEALAENAVGAQGDVVRSEINNDLWDATITVQATSPQASFLRSLKNRTEPFSIWNINKALGVKEGGSMALMTEAPSDEQGAAVGDLEFVFTVYDGDIIPVEN